jgi:phosphatidylglycerol:prolipoprotein diacylglycerol transferase
MRSRIIDYLNGVTHSNIFQLLIPLPELVYIIAFLIVALIYHFRSQRLGLNRSLTFWSLMVGGISAFLGAKLFYVLLHIEGYLLLPSHILAPGGTFSWGAYIGLCLGLYLFLRLKHQPVLPYLDVLGSCLGIGPFIGRWSCYLNGDDYGKVTDLFWAVKYPVGSIPFAAHANDGLIPYSSQLSASVHPNQLYLSLNGLLLFFLMSWIWKKFNKYQGLTFGLFFLFYGVSRFYLEFFRDEAGTSLLPVLNFPQIMSLTIVTMSTAYLLYLYGNIFRDQLIQKNRLTPIK